MGLALTGEPLTAERAEAWGMIWKCVDDDKLRDEADALAAKFASAPTKGLAATKKLHPRRRGRARSTRNSMSSATRNARSAAPAITRKASPPSWKSAPPKFTGKLSLMKPITLQNYAEGKWVAGAGGLAELRSAIDGEVVALTSSQGLDFGAMLKLRARSRAGRRCARSPSTSARRC